MRKIFFAVAIAPLALLGCNNRDNARTDGTNRNDQPSLGMKPAEEHPGQYPRVAPPGPDQRTSVGRLEQPTLNTVDQPSEPGASVMGRVTARESHELTLRDDTGANVTLKIAPDAKVVRNRQPVGLSQLREGEEVRANFELQGDQKVARKVEILQRHAPPQNQ